MSEREDILDGAMNELAHVLRRLNAPMSIDDDAESLALALYDPLDRVAKVVLVLAQLMRSEATP